VKGTKRFKAGAWRLEVDAGTDPVTGRRRRLNRTVRAPNNKRGERQADTELAKLVVEARAQLTLPSTGVTTEELVERYIVSRSTRWAPGAADATRRRVAQHITPHIGAVAIERLRPIDVEHWHATLRAAGVSEGSIGRVHDILRAALNWGERLELIGRNPAVKVDRPRGTKPVITPPAPADIVRMIAEASVSLALFLRLAALTGARRGQLCGLHWSDVDLDAATIRWTRSLAKVPGGVVEKETKTGARWPIAIDPATVDLLRPIDGDALSQHSPPASRCRRAPTFSPVTRLGGCPGIPMAPPRGSPRCAIAWGSRPSGYTTFATGWRPKASATVWTSRRLRAGVAGRTPRPHSRSTPTFSRHVTPSWPAGLPSAWMTRRLATADSWQRRNLLVLDRPLARQRWYAAPGTRGHRRRALPSSAWAGPPCLSGPGLDIGP
jgi:integrase